MIKIFKEIKEKKDVQNDIINKPVIIIKNMDIEGLLILLFISLEQEESSSSFIIFKWNINNKIF